MSEVHNYEERQAEIEEEAHAAGETHPEASGAPWNQHPLMGVPLPDGIGDGVILSVSTPAGPVLQHTLIMGALLARASGGGLLPFVYRDPYDPEVPDAPRPLRRATLAIINDRIAEEQPARAEATAMDRDKCKGSMDPR